VATLIRPSGDRIGYTDHGGDGPAVVFLHSFAMDGTMFQPQIAAFGPEYRCITVDERGNGESLTEADFTYWDIASDVLAVLDELGIGSAIVSGTSQGGFIGLRMALQAPGRVGGLVLMGTSADAEDPGVAASYRGLGQAWFDNGPTQQLIDTVASIVLGDLPAEDWKAKWRTIDGPRFLRNVTTLVERDSVVGRLGEITVPALVLHGSADAAYPVAKAEQIVAGLPQADPLVVIDNGAHYLSLTHPDAVNGHLETFLKRNA
jgi:pimeloyl-ACP methyl ester carboxylesterase